MSTTREKILAHALDRFNEVGLEAVGIRDIARELDMSPGNLSYHFPRKDDLVAALAEQLAERNTTALAANPRALSEFMATYRQMFVNQAEYRFLTVSIVSIVEHNAVVASNYAAGERGRRAKLRERMEALQVGGGLRDLTDLELRRILGHITLHARMWLIERRISFHEAPIAAVIDHYLHLLAALLAPYANDEGSEMLAPYLAAPLLS